MDGYMLRRGYQASSCPPWRIDADGTSFFSEDCMGCPQVIDGDTSFLSGFPSITSANNLRLLFWGLP
jgi:hypothetical protein